MNVSRNKPQVVANFRRESNERAKYPHTRTRENRGTGDTRAKPKITFRNDIKRPLVLIRRCLRHCVSSLTLIKIPLSLLPIKTVYNHQRPPPSSTRKRGLRETRKFARVKWSSNYRKTFRAQAFLRPSL